MLAPTGAKTRNYVGAVACVVIDAERTAGVKAGAAVSGKVAGAETGTDRAEVDTQAGAGAGADTGTDRAGVDTGAGTGAGAEANSKTVVHHTLPHLSSQAGGNGLGFREGRTACCIFSNLFFYYLGNMHII